MANFNYRDLVKFTRKEKTDFDDIVKGKGNYGTYLCKEQGYNFVAYSSGDVFGIKDEELELVTQVKPRTEAEVKSDHDQLLKFTDLVKDTVDPNALNDMTDEEMLEEYPNARLMLIQYAKAFNEAKKWYEDQAKLGHIDENKIKVVNAIVNDADVQYI